ncbi:MAG TPA: demethoxyubiquinone hydroxylase family protein [Steroidobacteraceae bacterium]
MAAGISTAMLGKRAIWACTAAIESTVNGHLEHQLEFLGPRDPEVLAAVESIRVDEQAHEHHARESGGDAGGVYIVLRFAIKGATSLAIWLSTRL